MKWIGVNSTFITFADFEEKLHELTGVKKILVYGTGDDDFACVPMLQAIACENLEIITVEGANHEFTGMVNEFIALIDLI